ncbi:MAG: hypothetical protein ACE5FL_06980 [Myxococcota bacterium]
MSAPPAWRLARQAICRFPRSGGGPAESGYTLGVMRRITKMLAAVGMGLALLVSAAPVMSATTEPPPEEPSKGLRAATEPYDSGYSGHPLRIAAYVVHPIGVILDTLVLRPIWWIGSHEPFYTLFGRTD